MKCNKCLKTIPKGEEIRFNARNHLYGGNYCENCWKESKYYRYYESCGKKSDGCNIPSYGWFMIGFGAGAVVGLIVWLAITKNKKCSTEER